MTNLKYTKDVRQAFKLLESNSVNKHYHNEEP